MRPIYSIDPKFKDLSLTNLINFEKNIVGRHGSMTLLVFAQKKFFQKLEPFSDRYDTIIFKSIKILWKDPNPEYDQT